MAGPHRFERSVDDSSRERERRRRVERTDFLASLLTGSKWKPLPAEELKNRLPDEGCSARQGTLVPGGRSLVLIATGARTIVSHIYLRNTGAPFGENLVLASLAELARCPVPGAAGHTDWYRVKAAATQPGFLSVQRSCEASPVKVSQCRMARTCRRCSRSSRECGMRGGSSGA